MKALPSFFRHLSFVFAFIYPVFSRRLSLLHRSFGQLSDIAYLISSFCLKLTRDHKQISLGHCSRTPGTVNSIEILTLHFLLDIVPEPLVQWTMSMFDSLLPLWNCSRSLCTMNCCEIWLVAFSWTLFQKSLIHHTVSKFDSLLSSETEATWWSIIWNQYEALGVYSSVEQKLWEYLVDSNLNASFFSLQLGKSGAGGSVQRSIFFQGVFPLGGNSPSTLSALISTGIACPVSSPNFRCPRTAAVSAPYLLKGREIWR